MVVTWSNWVLFQEYYFCLNSSKLFFFTRFRHYFGFGEYLLVALGDFSRSKLLYGNTTTFDLSSRASCIVLLHRHQDQLLIFGMLVCVCLCLCFYQTGALRIWIRARCTTLCGKVCQWFATGRWFSPGPLFSSTNKIDRHDITEILLKVALNTIKQTNKQSTFDNSFLSPPYVRIALWL